MYENIAHSEPAISSADEHKLRFSHDPSLVSPPPRTVAAIIWAHDNHACLYYLKPFAISLGPLVIPVCLYGSASDTPPITHII